MNLEKHSINYVKPHSIFVEINDHLHLGHIWRLQSATKSEMLTNGMRNFGTSPLNYGNHDKDGIGAKVMENMGVWAILPSYGSKFHSFH